jgi:hypothetical protein
MAAPVWVLSVDLQTRTATFQSGMGDAAKAARGAFTEIKSGADEMGRETSGSMMEARHGVMLLGEEFGVHLPRGVTTFLASLGPVAGVMEAAFPFLAIIAGATVLLNHLASLKEAAAKMSTGFTKLDDGIRTHIDELDLSTQKFKDLIAKLEGKPYNGAAAALLEAKVAADHLSDSLSGDLQKIEELLKESAHGSLMTFLMGENSSNQAKDIAQSLAAQLSNIPHDSNFSANMQAALKDAWLKAQVDIKSNEVKGSSDDNKGLQELQQALSGYSHELEAVGTNDAWKKQYENISHAVEESHKLSASNTEINSSYAKLTDWVVEYGKAVRSIPKDSSGTKALEETLKDFSQMAAAARAADEVMIKADREAAAGTKEIADAAAEQKLSAVKNELSEGLISKREAIQQEMELDKQALARKVDDIATAAAEQIKAYQHEQEVAKQSASNQSALGVKKGDSGYVDYLGEVANLQTKIDATGAKANADVQAATLHTATTLGTLNSALQGTEALWRNYFQRMKSETADLATTINSTLQGSFTKLEDGFAGAMARSIVEGKSFGKEMMSVGREVSESMIEGLIRWGVQDLITKMGMKASAASLAGANATASMAAAPWPVDMGAPAFGATMMGTALAFDKGGLVPGVTNFDSVPAMLTPGEAVLPKRLTDNLMHGNTGESSGAKEIHVHHHNTFKVQALDSEGVDRVLTKHSDTFERHFTNHVRKMNH